MAGESAGHLTIDVRAEIKGDVLHPQIQLYAGDTPIGLYPVDVHIANGTVTYRTADGDVVATAKLADHLACPTCGHALDAADRTSIEAAQ
ncbi:hypothetical protein ACFV6Y_38340 [Streptomyces massasporeus]|uniref:hypothetical protein n=1 Tax=Streptomyces massasporeus TaxID=67324 RepID=UPI00364F1980